jgi:hypothetical protein
MKNGNIVIGMSVVIVISLLCCFCWCLIHQGKRETMESTKPLDIFEQSYECIELNKCTSKYNDYVSIRRHISGINPSKFAILIQKRKNLGRKLTQYEFDKIIGIKTD